MNRDHWFDRAFEACERWHYRLLAAAALFFVVRLLLMPTA